MDIATHALASVVLSRAILPRAPKLLWAWTIPAGVIADSDRFSALISPSKYLDWYRTYTHALLTSLLIAVAAAIAHRLVAAPELRQRLPVRAIFVAVLLTGWLHLGMDVMQWQGVELFWPFGSARIAADWLPTIDPWILTVLLATLALPEFFHLVNAEIGVRDKQPRGFAAAIVGLIVILLYAGLRAELHATAVAQLQNRTYVGEMPRRVAAFSGFTSLVSWHGLTETESALHEVTVRIGSRRASALDPGVNLFKPEANPLLQAAQATRSSERFLRIARFPKAAVQKTDSGSLVWIRDLRYTAAGGSEREPVVAIEFDPAGNLKYETIVWADRETPH